METIPDLELFGPFWFNPSTFVKQFESDPEVVTGFLLAYFGTCTEMPSMFRTLR